MDTALQQHTSPKYLNERRSEDRRRIFLRARVSGLEEGQAVVCTVLNASHSGCKIFSKDIAKLPADLWLEFGDISVPISGQLVWRDAFAAGIKFMWDKSDQRPAGRA